MWLVKKLLKLLWYPAGKNMFEMVRNPGGKRMPELEDQTGQQSGRSGQKSSS